MVLVFTQEGKFTKKTTLALAATDIDCVGKSIVVVEPQTLDGDVTFLNDRSLEIKQGGVITTTGYTLDIQCPFTAGLYQCFDGTGTITGLIESFPEWFGAVGDDSTDDSYSIAKAIIASDTVVFKQKYKSNPIAISKNTVFKMEPWSQLTLNTNTVSGHLISVSAGITFGISCEGNGLGVLDGAKSLGSNLRDIINCQGVLYLNNIRVQNGIQYGVRLVNTSNCRIGYLEGNGMTGPVISTEDTTYSRIDTVYGHSDNLGHIVNITYESNNISIGSVFGYTTLSGASVRFALEVFSDNAARIPSDISCNSVIVDGQSLGGGVSFSRGVRCTVGTVVATNCKGISCMEFAQGATDCIANNVVAKNSSGIAITGTVADRVVRCSVLGGSVINMISGASPANGVYMLHATDCNATNIMVAGARSHSVRLSDCITCSFTNGNIKGDNSSTGSALTGIYLDSTSVDNIVKGNRITNHMTTGRFAIQTASSAVERTIIEDNVCNNNAGFISDSGVNTRQRGNSRNYTSPLNGPLTLSAGTTTTVVNTNVQTTSFINLSPTNSAAAALASVYISTKNSGASFVITHSTAVGTETFDYMIV